MQNKSENASFLAQQNLSVYFYPQACKVPELESMPLSLKQPLRVISAIDSVAGVITSFSGAAVELLITFKHLGCPEYRKAINCFRGLKPQSLYINGPNKYMMLTIIF